MLRNFREVLFNLRETFLVPLIGGCLVVYFAYYAVFGERGLRTLLRTETELHQAQEKLTSIQTENNALRKKVERLRPSSIDPDLLEERGRTVLNFTHPNDIVIMKTVQDKKSR